MYLFRFFGKYVYKGPDLQNIGSLGRSRVLLASNRLQKRIVQGMPGPKKEDRKLLTHVPKSHHHKFHQSQLLT